METTWGQHKDNVETTSGPRGCGDHMGTAWRQHEDNLDLIEIIQLFEDLCFSYTPPPPPMGGCMGGWVDGWVNMLVNGWSHVISIKIK